MSSIIDVNTDKTRTAVAVAAAAGTAYLLYNAVKGSSPPSAREILRGPKSPSFLQGHLRKIVEFDIDELEAWLKEYGGVFVTKGFLGIDDIFTADPKAAAYILNHSMEFTKPPHLTRIILAWAGPGVFAAEGEKHKKQRHILSPAFSPSQIKSLDTIMVQKANELKDIWVSKLQESVMGEESITLDVLDWASRASLDIIGETCFGFKLQTLESTHNELAEALHALFGATTALDPMEFLIILVPSLRHLPLERNKAIKRSRDVLKRIGTELIEEKRAEFARLSGEGEDPAVSGKDLLSVLIRNNLKDTSDAKMTDEEILAQINTFIMAGHDTSSASISWTLYALAKNHALQKKLREELLAFPNADPSADELNSLHFLDCVVKESLRLYSPAISIPRVAVNDVIIPLGEPVVDKNGNSVNEIFVRAGESVGIWPQAFNCSTKWWGLDAHEFKPERFAEPLPAAVAAIPSIFSSSTTFGAGPHACIGWRFALQEIKAILFVLVRNFDFDIDHELVIKSKVIIVARPSVEGEAETRLPLKISLHDVKY